MQNEDENRDKESEDVDEELSNGSMRNREHRIWKILCFTDSIVPKPIRYCSETFNRWITKPLEGMYFTIFIVVWVVCIGFGLEDRNGILQFTYDFWWWTFFGGIFTLIGVRVIALLSLVFKVLNLTVDILEVKMNK